jgi:hypothetical protein
MITLRIELRLHDLPLITFHGHPTQITQWQSRWETQSHTWDPKLSLVHNLERILLCSLPKKQEQGKVECGICFTHSLNGSLPQLSCINEQCHYQYHSECLVSVD